MRFMGIPASGGRAVVQQFVYGLDRQSPEVFA